MKAEDWRSGAKNCKKDMCGELDAAKKVDGWADLLSGRFAGRVRARQSCASARRGRGLQCASNEFGEGDLDSRRRYPPQTKGQRGAASAIVGA